MGNFLSVKINTNDPAMISRFGPNYNGLYRLRNMAANHSLISASGSILGVCHVLWQNEIPLLSLVFDYFTSYTVVISDKSFIVGY